MYIRVTITPQSKKDHIEQIGDARFAVSVKAKAERNEANKSMISLVRTMYPKAGQIKIVSGHHSRTKLLSIEDNLL